MGLRIAIVNSSSFGRRFPEHIERLERLGQVERVRVRDGLSTEQAQARIANQLPMAERNARANKVINSDRPMEKTQAELNQLYMQLLRRIG